MVRSIFALLSLSATISYAIKAEIFELGHKKNIQAHALRNGQLLFSYQNKSSNQTKLATLKENGKYGKEISIRDVPDLVTRPNKQGKYLICYLQDKKIYDSSQRRAINSPLKKYKIVQQNKIGQDSIAQIERSFNGKKILFRIFSSGHKSSRYDISRYGIPHNVIASEDGLNLVLTYDDESDNEKRHLIIRAGQKQMIRTAYNLYPAYISPQGKYIFMKRVGDPDYGNSIDSVLQYNPRVHRYFRISQLNVRSSNDLDNLKSSITLKDIRNRFHFPIKSYQGSSSKVDKVCIGGFSKGGLRLIQQKIDQPAALMQISHNRDISHNEPILIRTNLEQQQDLFIPNYKSDWIGKKEFYYNVLLPKIKKLKKKPGYKMKDILMDSDTGKVAIVFTNDIIQKSFALFIDYKGHG